MHNYNLEDVGCRLRCARLLRGKTAYQVARHIGVDKSTICRYETAFVVHPSLPTLRAAADYLQVNLGWILCTDGVEATDCEEECRWLKVVLSGR